MKTVTKPLMKPFAKSHAKSPAKSPAKTKGRQVQFGLTAVSIVAFGTFVSCASPPPPPAHSVAEGALLLGDEPRVDELNCPDGNCVHWYRVEVPRKGTLSLNVEAFESVRKERGSLFSRSSKDDGPPKFLVTLSDEKGDPLSSVKSNPDKQASIKAKVWNGSHLISITADSPGRPFGYRVSASFKEAPKPKPTVRTPKYKARDATILEAEGWGTDVEALLINLGSSDGMSAGLNGRLLDEGEEIGKVKIEQVYPDGSRASVVGPLSRPLGPNAQVEIMVPIP